MKTQSAAPSRAKTTAARFELRDESGAPLRVVVMTKNQVVAANLDLFDQWLCQDGAPYQHCWSWKREERP